MAAACSAAQSARPDQHKHAAVLIAARPAPAGWLRATLPGGGAVLAYPGSMHLVSGALVISLAVGLFGFHESIHAAYVVESLIIESLAAVILGTWTVIAAAAVPRRG